jgi:hypothetical protein
MSKSLGVRRHCSRIATKGAATAPETTMKYMLLIHADPAREPAPGTPEFDAMMQAFMSLDERMSDRAKVLACEELRGVDTATTVRLQAGSVQTTDGPFAEAREHLGGFYLIEAASLDDAIAFAAAMPSAEWGAVEIRPVVAH